MTRWCAREECTEPVIGTGRNGKKVYCSYRCKHYVASMAYYARERDKLLPAETRACAYSRCSTVIPPEANRNQRYCRDRCRSRAGGERYREYHNQRARDFRATHPELSARRVRDATARRRARVTATQDEPFTRADVYRRDNWTCHLCGRPVDVTLPYRDPMAPELDHVIPLARGGTHIFGNVRLAHMTCNRRKNARTADDARRTLTAP